MWKNTVCRILEQKCSSPKLKVNSRCNCFRIMRANKKRLGTFGAGGFWCTTYFGRNCHDFFLCEIGRHTCTTPGPSGRRDQSCSLQHPWRKLARDWAHLLQGKDCPVSGFASFGTVSFEQPVWWRIVTCAPKNLSIKKDIFLTYKHQILHLCKYIHINTHTHIHIHILYIYMYMIQTTN